MGTACASFFVCKLCKNKKLMIMNYWRTILACCFGSFLLGQPLAGNELTKARQICGYAENDKLPEWDSMSEEGREYIGPMGAEPSAIFNVDDSYPEEIQSEKQLWQLLWAMHKELKTVHYFEPGAVKRGKDLKDWMKRINTFRTLHVTLAETMHENKPATAIIIRYASDMRIYAAFRNPDLIDKLSEKEQGVLASCAEWISQNISKGMPNMLKIKKIHDAIVEGTTYTKGFHFTPELILDGVGVCSAYTTACQLLLHMVKIDCRYAHGEVSTTCTDTHAWNFVDVNGEWYHMDSTWDDPGNNLCYTYFLICDEEMDIDHDWPLKGEDEDIYPTTPEINALNFHKRAYFEYKPDQQRTEDQYYTDGGGCSNNQLFGIMPEEDLEKLQELVPDKLISRATPLEKTVAPYTGKLPARKVKKAPASRQQGYVVKSEEDFNKLIKQCAEKLEGPKIVFKISGGCTSSARDMLNASDIHLYVSKYSFTSSEPHPLTPDPEITLTVEYRPEVRLLSAHKNKEAAAKLTAEESAALFACRKLAEAYDSKWKIRRQKIRDAYQHLTTRVNYAGDEEHPATDALLKGMSDSLGYAVTMQVLCEMMEIPCQLVHGRTRDALHAWNLVRWSGKRWYHADAAMDAAEGYTREYSWKHEQECDEDQLAEHAWYLDEHPATPPASPVKNKAEARELLKKLRAKAEEKAAEKLN